MEFAPALAKLAVGVGANLAPGQTVVLNGKLGQDDTRGPVEYVHHVVKTADLSHGTNGTAVSINPARFN